MLFGGCEEGPLAAINLAGTIVGVHACAGH
jgi:hypothetical protein